MTDKTLDHQTDTGYFGVVDKQGRIVLRKSLRDLMGMPKGGPVNFRVDDTGSLIISNAKSNND